MDTCDFKVNRETFSASQTVLDTSFEQPVERDFVLPDYYPDIFRILKCTVIPKILSNSINGGKLTVETTVLVRVLYLSENNCRVNCIEQKMNFSKTLELNSACTNPFVCVNPKCDYINCRVVSQRRLDIRGAVTTAVKVTGEVLQPVVTDAFGCNIQLKKQLVTYPAKRLNVSKRITVIEELELSASKPAVGSILRSDCEVSPQDTKIIAGKMITKGDAEISMLYSCVTTEGEDTVETMKFTVPFSQIIDVEGIDETCQADLDISVGGCEIIPKGEDSTSLECEIIIIVNCVAVKYETCEIVSDAYSTCYECETSACGTKLETAPAKVDESLSQSCTISRSDENIGCVYDSWANVENVSSRFDEDKNCFVVSGNVKYCVMGRYESKTPFLLETENPFEQCIALPDSYENSHSALYEPRVRTANCSYYLADANSIELKAEIKIGGIIRQQCAKQLISEIKVKTDCVKQKQDCYALKLCYCRKNDDIWEIAKRYSTSITAIMEENELDDDKVTEQGMLLIPLMN